MIKIDLASDQGNVFHLLLAAAVAAETMGQDPDATIKRLRALNDYDDIVSVIRKQYGHLITIC